MTADTEIVDRRMDETNSDDGIETTKQHKLPPGFNKAQVKKAIEALMKHEAVKKQDSLFPDSPTRYLMDINVFRTPSDRREYFNIVLPFSPHPSPADGNLEILLIVRDDKGKEPEHTVGEIKDLLRESNVSSDDLKVNQILTFKQLKDEYSTFEARRALSKSVDVVVAENDVFKMLHPVLGRDFVKKKKFPLGIPGRSFKDYDLGEQILYALEKTTLHISTKGQTSTVVIGHDNLDADALTENVSKMANWMKIKFPGGWKNIKSLSISNATEGIPPLVVYFSAGSKPKPKSPEEDNAADDDE